MNKCKKSRTITVIEASEFLKAPTKGLKNKHSLDGGVRGNKRQPLSMEFVTKHGYSTNEKIIFNYPKITDVNKTKE